MPDKKPLPVPKGKLVKRQEASPAPPPERIGIIAAVKTPLGFFALVVLAVEAILGATTVLSKLNEAHQFILVMLMISILVLMILGSLTNSGVELSSRFLAPLPTGCATTRQALLPTLANEVRQI